MSTNTITINEFKMWLQGVEEMQDDNWTPDSKQWARIREKIRAITESTSDTHLTTQYTRPQYAAQSSYTAPIIGDNQPVVPAPTFDIPQNIPTHSTPSVGIFGNGMQSSKLPSDTTGGAGPYATPFA